MGLLKGSAQHSGALTSDLDPRTLSGSFFSQQSLESCQSPGGYFATKAPACFVKADRFDPSSDLVNTPFLHRGSLMLNKNTLTHLYGTRMADSTETVDVTMTIHTL